MTHEEAIANLNSLLMRADLTDEYGEMEDMTPYEEAVEMAIEALKERKTGKWIYHIDDIFPMESTKECDQCRTEQDLDCDGNFCPWCGAKMEGAEE